MAAPVLTHSVNPVSEIAAGPGTKAKQAAEKAADKLGGQGALAPDVEGQIRKWALHKSYTLGHV